MAFELASRLGLKNLISTDMIREVMRKIVSQELSPVIHKSSFNAYESIRITTFRFRIQLLKVLLVMWML